MTFLASRARCVTFCHDRVVRTRKTAGKPDVDWLDCEKIKSNIYFGEVVGYAELLFFFFP